MAARLAPVADLGRAALFVAFGLALYAVVAGGFAAHDGRRRLHESARNALVGAFAATAVAALVLLHAFNARDFTFTYVADHSSRKLPSRTPGPASGAARRARSCCGCSCSPRSARSPSR
jgi:hypothetical protein